MKLSAVFSKHVMVVAQAEFGLTVITFELEKN